MILSPYTVFWYLLGRKDLQGSPLLTIKDLEKGDLMAELYQEDFTRNTLIKLLMGDDKHWFVKQPRQFDRFRQYSISNEFRIHHFLQGKLSVPQLIHFEEASSVLITEHIEVTPLEDTLSSNNKIDIIERQIPKLLAQFHNVTPKNKLIQNEWYVLPESNFLLNRGWWTQELLVWRSAPPSHALAAYLFANVMLEDTPQKALDRLSTKWLNAYIIHNDFRLQNILIDKNNKLYIVDFERASIGDAYWDLGYYLASLFFANSKIQISAPYFNERINNILESYFDERKRELPNLDRTKLLHKVIQYCGLALLENMYDEIRRIIDKKQRILPFNQDKCVRYALKMLCEPHFFYKNPFLPMTNALNTADKSYFVLDQ